MTDRNVASLAAVLGGAFEGDGEVRVRGVRAVNEAGEGDIAVVLDPRLVPELACVRASALVVPAGFPADGRPVVRVANPRRALRLLLELFHPEAAPAGVEQGARIASTAVLGRGVYVAAGATVGDGAVIGDGSCVHTGAVVGAGATLGRDCVLHPNVTLYPGVRLGDRVRVHSGAVIGSDGFGYDRGADGAYHKIPQVGTVEVGDDVEIGANTAIDRATLGVTRIARGTKIDNLVQIGHNCSLGPDCCLAGQAGLSGSVRLGAGVELAGQAGVADHVTIGDRVRVGAKSGVHSDLAAGDWLGSPVMPAGEASRALAVVRRLPELRTTLRRLEARVRELEAEVARLRGEAEPR